MTTTTIPFDPARFLSDMRGVSYSRVGIYMLIASHILLSADQRMTQASILRALRSTTTFAMDLVSSVIERDFNVDSEGVVTISGMGSEGEPTAS